MGWQSPQPGHQSAGSLRKHLRELGRQLKGADWHYRKVTQSTVCLTQQFYVPADSLGRRWLPAQASAPFGGIPREHDRARLARTTGHEPRQRYALLQLFSPPRFPTCKPRKTHPCRAIHIRTAWQKVPTSTSYHIQKGPKEEALTTKITPLASSYTARVAHRSLSAPQKKANIITLLTHGSHFLCQKPSEKQPPICRGHAGKLFAPTQDHPARSTWPPHLPAISIGFSLFRLSLLPASEICAPKAAFRSRSVSLPVLRDLKRGHITWCRKSTGARFQLTSTPVCVIPGPQPLNTTQRTVWS